MRRRHMAWGPSELQFRGTLQKADSENNLMYPLEF